MTARRIRVLLVLGLTLSMLAGIARPAAAEASSYAVYFPWVPYQSTIGGLGPFDGTVTIQNLEAETITARFRSSLPGSGERAYQIPANGAMSVRASELGIPEPGSGVIVTANKFAQASSVAKIAGSLKQAAPWPPDAMSRTNDEHEVVDGYMGQSIYQITAEQVLPIVQTNNGWNSVIRVTNFGNAMTGIAITIKPQSGGPTQIFNANVETGGTYSFDLLDNGFSPGFVGSAIVAVAGPRTSLGVVVERHKPSTNMLIMNIATRSTACDTWQYAPLVFDNYNNWNTGISVVNLGTSANNLTVTYYDIYGDIAGSRDLQIPAESMDFIYTPADGAGDEFLGAATIQGNQPLCAVVDEVKYTGDEPDVGHAMSYATTYDVVSAGESLYMPLVQRGALATGLGDTSGIQIFNPTDSTIVVDVYLRNEDGSAGSPVLQYFIGGKESQTLYAMQLDIPDGFQGSMSIDAYSGDGSLIAISNNVNYDVQYDGSSSFVLIPSNMITQ